MANDANGFLHLNQLLASISRQEQLFSNNSGKRLRQHKRIQCLMGACEIKQARGLIPRVEMFTFLQQKVRHIMRMNTTLLHLPDP